MVELFMLLILVALGVICWNLRQIGEGVTIIAAALQVDAMKKAGVVDEIRAAVLKRAEENRTA